METILCLLHTEGDGSLAKAAREAVSAAIELSRALSGSRLAVGLVGPNLEAAADSIASCGAGDVLGVSGEEFGISRYSTDAAAAAALAGKSGASIVVAPASARWARALPGVAARLGGRVDTQVTAIAQASGRLEIQRWYYRQRMAGTLSRSQRPWILLLAAGAFAPFTGSGVAATSNSSGSTTRIGTVTVELPDGAQRTRVVGIEAAATGTQTINPDADLLFVAGAGWTKKQADGEAHLKEAEARILDFIRNTHASLGSSKSLVEQSAQGQAVLPFLSHLNQVGQTGSTPRHPKGLATCCHGEEPHVVGWRFIRERRAVNTDPGCGWAQGKADVLYVADAFRVMARVNELLGGT